MKIMIASDLHGSAYYTEKLTRTFVKDGYNKLLLLGDILYIPLRKRHCLPYKLKNAFWAFIPICTVKVKPHAVVLDK